MGIYTGRLPRSIIHIVILFVGQEEGDDEEWSVDTSEEAIAQRMLALSSGAKGLTLNDDLEKTASERLEIFYKFVQVKCHCPIFTLRRPRAIQFAPQNTRTGV